MPVTLATDIVAGDRRALAKGITLVESTRDDHRADAEALLHELLPHTGGSIRVGITGAPGVGKSTFIEALGLHLVDQGHRLAVLAVDPSSARTHGSILGDKTRMIELSKHPSAFIRPTPSGTALGGVARRTREALLLCEAAGFDVVIVETVGVGQSETMVAQMVDCFVLLLAPGGGDELQGIKRGIMELADLVVVNKADGDLAAAAGRAAAEYAHALHLVVPRSSHWSPAVLQCSALRGSGLAEVWTTVETHQRTLSDAGVLTPRRHEQNVAWLHHEVSSALAERWQRDPAMRSLMTELERDVGDGRLNPPSAARHFLKEMFR